MCSLFEWYNFGPRLTKKPHSFISIFWWWDATCTFIIFLVLIINKIQCHNSCSDEENKNKFLFFPKLHLVAFLRELGQIGLILFMGPYITFDIGQPIPTKRHTKFSCSNKIDVFSSLSCHNPEVDGSGLKRKLWKRKWKRKRKRKRKLWNPQ